MRLAKKHRSINIIPSKKKRKDSTRTTQVPNISAKQNDLQSPPISL